MLGTFTPWEAMHLGSSGSQVLKTLIKSTTTLQSWLIALSKTLSLRSHAVGITQLLSPVMANATLGDKVSSDN